MGLSKERGRVPVADVSGELRIPRSLVSSTPAIGFIAGHPVVAVDATRVRWSGGIPVEPQFLIIEHRSEAAYALSNAIGSSSTPSSDELAAARAALARIADRSSESTDEWANELGTKLASYID